MLSLFLHSITSTYTEENKAPVDDLPTPIGPISKKLAKLGQEVGGGRREVGGARSRRKVERNREKGPEGLLITPEQAHAIFCAYEPLDAGVDREEPITPIV